MVHSTLSNREWDDQGLEREAELPQDLEACSIEPDGSAIVWSGDGRPVRITPEDREVVATLLLDGHITNKNIFSMLDAAAETDSPILHAELVNFVEKLICFIPPYRRPGLTQRLTQVRERTEFFRSVTAT